MNRCIKALIIISAILKVISAQKVILKKIFLFSVRIKPQSLISVYYCFATITTIILICIYLLSTAEIIAIV
jgi:hypothetical protein